MTSLGLFDLLEDLELQRGVDVAEQHVGGVDVRLGELGAEVGEDVELRVERDAAHQVGVVAAGPAERLAGGALEPGEVDAAPRQRLEVAGGKSSPTTATMRTGEKTDAAKAE